MTELDKALDSLQQDPEDTDKQTTFYNLFLNTTFFIPSIKKSFAPTGKVEEEEVDLPMIVPSEGIDYLILFDTEERLHEWAGKEVPFLAIPGHAVADFSPENFRWSVNNGRAYSKEFVSEEIAWLKEVVRKYNAADDGGKGTASTCTRKA